MSTTEINLSLTLSTRHGGHYQIVSSDAPALFKMPVDSGYQIDKAKEPVNLRLIGRVSLVRVHVDTLMT